MGCGAIRWKKYLNCILQFTKITVAILFFHITVLNHYLYDANFLDSCNNIKIELDLHKISSSWRSDIF